MLIKILLFARKCPGNWLVKNMIPGMMQFVKANVRHGQNVTFVIKKDLSLQSMISRYMYDINLWYLQKQPPEVFCKKGILRNFAKFTGKHLCQRPFFAGLRPASLLIKSFWRRCFPVNFAIFLGTPFTEHIRTTASVSLQSMICKETFLVKIL